MVKVRHVQVILNSGARECIKSIKVLTSIEVESKMSVFIRIRCPLTGKFASVNVCMADFQGVSDMAPTGDLSHD